MVNKASVLAVMTALMVSNARGEGAMPFNYTGVHFDKASGQYFVNDRPKFNIKPLTKTDFLDRIEFALNDNSFAPYDGQIKFSEEGLHMLRFKAVDPVNNWSPVQSFRIYVDLTRPVTQLSWAGDHHWDNSKLFVSPRANLSMVANDNLSGVSKVVWKNGEGKFHEYRTPVTFEKEGPYEFSFMSIDNVGNHENVQLQPFVVDATAPKTEVNIQGNVHKVGGKMYTKLGAQLVLTALDGVSGVKKIEMQVNGMGPQKYERPLVLDKKVSKVMFRAVDNVGNAEKWQEYVVHVDTDAPKLDVKKVGNHQWVGGKIFATPGIKLRVSTHDEDSGVKTLSMNGEQKELKGHEMDMPSLDKDGSYEVIVSAVDNVGNKSNTENLTVVVDSAPPVSTATTMAPMVERAGVHYSTIPNKMMINCDDLGVGVKHVEVSYDGKAWHKLSGEIDFSTWKDAQRTVHYRGVDGLGNTEMVKKMTIAIRDKGPAVGLFVEADGMGEVPLSEVKNRPGMMERSPASEKTEKKVEMKEE